MENINIIRLNNLKQALVEETLKILIDYFSKKNEYIFSIVQQDNYKANKTIALFLEKLPIIVTNLFNSEKILLNSNTEEEEYAEYLHICEKCNRSKCTLESVFHIIIREYAEILQKNDIQDNDFNEDFFKNYSLPCQINLSSVKNILRQFSVYYDKHKMAN
jgi:hypothetical protein